MTDHPRTRLPTVKQIDKARIPLRQAADLAIQIEAMDGFAPDNVTACHCRQLVFQMEQVAMRLGYELRPLGPVLAVDNSKKENA